MLFKFLCRHNKVKITRWHPDVIRSDMVGKELYRDRHNVANFVECCDCGKIFQGSQPKGMTGWIFDRKETE